MPDTTPETTTPAPPTLEDYEKAMLTSSYVKAHEKGYFGADAAEIGVPADPRDTAQFVDALPVGGGHGAVVLGRGDSNATVPTAAVAPSTSPLLPGATGSPSTASKPSTGSS